MALINKLFIPNSFLPFFSFTRFSKKNLVLWGLWQGKGKPVMSTFLPPFLCSAQSLRKQGKQIKGTLVVSRIPLNFR